MGQKDLGTTHLLVVDQRLLNWSEPQPSSSARQEANAYYAASETEVPDLASSSALQFPAITGQAPKSLLSCSNSLPEIISLSQSGLSGVDSHSSKECHALEEIYLWQPLSFGRG